MKYILTLFICSATFLITAQEIDVGEWQTTKTDLYQITYPSEWDIDSSGLNGTTMILLSQQSSIEDAFRDNINLMVQDLQGQEMNLDQFVQLSEMQIPQFFKNSSITLNERINQDEGEFHKMIYTGEYGGLSARFEQKIWLIDGKAYLLTWTCAIDECEQYQDTADAILSNFVLK